MKPARKSPRDDASNAAHAQHLSPAATRQRRRRTRDRRGLAVLNIETDYYRLVSAILANGSLSETEALDKAKVSRVAARMLEEVVALWLPMG